MKMMNDDRENFIRNLRKMSEVHTVLNSQSIKHILELVEGEWPEANKIRLVSLLKETISSIDELIKLRKQHSHDTRVSSLGAEISQKLRSLAEEFAR
jgi:hypothetical protein